MLYVIGKSIMICEDSSFYSILRNFSPCTALTDANEVALFLYLSNFAKQFLVHSNLLVRHLLAAIGTVNRRFMELCHFLLGLDSQILCVLPSFCVQGSLFGNF